MSSSLLLDHFVVRLLDGKSLLDVGCGKGKWGFLAHTNAQFLVANPPRRIAGCDVFLPYLHFCKRHVYEILVQCDVKFLPFRKRVFDIVLVAEVLEHASKEEGTKLLSEAERVSVKRVIVTTPQFPLPQETVDLNPYQKHVSRYSAKELKKRGYSVHGIGLHIWGQVIPIVIPKIPLRFAYLLVSYKEIKDIKHHQ